MTEDLHVRLSDADIRVLNQMVKRGLFETVSEAVRFGVKQVIQTQRFSSIVAPGLTKNQQLALASPVTAGLDQPWADLVRAALGAKGSQSNSLKQAFTSLQALRENLEHERELLIRAAEAVFQLGTAAGGPEDSAQDRKQLATR